ncbi:MAG TPA: MarR family winged helix-turn-helix transcriptional regulator [Cellulomonas sp.]
MPHDAAADDLLRRLGAALHDLSWAVRQVDDDGSDLPPLPPTEFEVMRYVDRHPGASVGQVAHGLTLRQNNVSAAVRGLLERDLVSREADPDDRRVTRLTATALAGQHRAPIEQGWSRVLADALSVLPGEDDQAVRDAVAPLERLAEVLRAGAARRPPAAGRPVR